MLLCSGESVARLRAPLVWLYTATAVYGYNCVICGINLKARYAGLPIEVIHVHHEEPLSQSDGEREFDPVVTMKPVCPNCHAVIHSRNPPYPISEVKHMVTGETFCSAQLPSAPHELDIEKFPNMEVSHETKSIRK